MNYHIWIQIKRVKQICNNGIEKKKVQDGYNTGYKFDYTRQCLIHKCQFTTKCDKLDLCGGGTSWEPDSYGDAGAGIKGRIANNYVLMKGG